MAVYKSKNATKDGRQYYFRIKYKDIFGVAHDYSSPKFKNKRDAENEEALYRIKIANQETTISNVTFEQIFNEYIISLSKNVKPQTTLRNKYMFERLKPLHSLIINDFNIQKYRQFQYELENHKFSIDYTNKIIELLRRLITYSNKYYGTSNKMLNYIEKYKKVNELKKEMDFFTYEEYMKFDSVIDNFEYHTFFEILFYMGLRQGETQALTWKDIDFKNNTLKVNKTLTTKIKGEKWTISSPKTKNSTRTLPITKKLVDDLKVMYNSAKKYKNFSNSWFVFGNAFPFPETTIQQRKNNYCKMADIKQIRIHDFRHSCATLLINNGASITLVSKWLGHADISITLKVYAHLYENELNKMANILNNL